LKIKVGQVDIQAELEREFQRLQRAKLGLGLTVIHNPTKWSEPLAGELIDNTLTVREASKSNIIGAIKTLRYRVKI
jgi:hypothetical protein